MKKIANNEVISASTIEEVIHVYNMDMELIREVFNKLIATSNRQNRRIFWLSIIGIGLAGSVYKLANKVVLLEEKVDNLTSKNVDIDEK